MARAQLNLLPKFGVATEAIFQRRCYSLLDALGQLRTGQVVLCGLLPFFSLSRPSQSHGWAFPS